MTAGLVFLAVVGLLPPAWRMWRGDWPHADRTWLS